MQIKFTSLHNGSRGYALIITMIFLTVCLVIFGSMLMWTSTNAKINQRNNQFNMSEAAAEAATERALAQMDRDFLSQSLTNASFYATLLPVQTNYNGSSWPVTYTFSDTNGSTNQFSVYLGPQGTNAVPLNSQYTGLYGLVQDCTITATATPVGQPYTVPATVSQTVQFASIPLFQFAIFYNLDLDISPGLALTVNGKTFCNRNIWIYPSGLVTFKGTVVAAGTITFAPNPNGDQTANVSPSPTTPIYQNGKNAGADELTMPIAGTNNNPGAVEAILNIPPAAYALGSPAAYSTNGQLYLANGADLIISNSAIGTNLFVFGAGVPYIPTGTNLTVYYQNSLNTPPLQKLTPDFYLLKTGGSTNYASTNTSAGKGCYTNVFYAGWSFVTNVAFYDYRESSTVQAVQIDVAKFNSWVINTNNNGGSSFNGDCIYDKGHWIDSIWVYNSTATNSTTLPGVRVVNGKILPSVYGLTVATPMPIYMLGDFNVQLTNGGPSDVGLLGTTTHTRPAALMGDAVTVLSANWSDTYNSDYNSRNAINTTVNAAFLEGIVQSTNFSGAPSGGYYSGGVENFIRYLEDWQGPGATNTYNGSIVVMFPSIIATNYWQMPGGYYTRPIRNWGFDTNYLRQSGLPPLAPQTKAVIRGNWSSQ